MPRKPAKIYVNLRAQRERADRAGGLIPSYIAANIRKEEREFHNGLKERADKACLTIAANLNACYLASGFTLAQIAKLTGIPRRTLTTILTKNLEGDTWQTLAKTGFMNYVLLTAFFKMAGFGDELDTARRQYL